MAGTAKIVDLGELKFSQSKTMTENYSPGTAVGGGHTESNSPSVLDMGMDARVALKSKYD